MGISTKEWYDLTYTGLMFYQASPQEVFNMERITDQVKEMFSRNKRNANTMYVGDTILTAASEAGIDEN